MKDPIDCPLPVYQHPRATTLSHTGTWRSSSQSNAFWVRHPKLNCQASNTGKKEAKQNSRVSALEPSSLPGSWCGSLELVSGYFSDYNHTSKRYGDVLILYKKGRGQTQRGQRFLMLTTSQKQLSRRKTQTYQAAFREGFFRRPCRRGWSLIPLPEGHWVLTKQKLLRWLRGGRCPNGRTARKKEETKQKKHAYDPQPKKKKKVNTRRSIEKVLLR